MKFIYIFSAGRSKNRYKIGISKNPKKRIAKIKSGNKGKYDVILIFCCPLLFAEKWEKALHRQHKKRKKPFKVGSGKTEWFRFRTPLLPILQILFFGILEGFCFFCFVFCIFLAGVNF